MHLISVGGDNVSVDCANEEESRLNKYICLFCYQFTIIFQLKQQKPLLLFTRHQLQTFAARLEVRSPSSK